MYRPGNSDDSGHFLARAVENSNAMEIGGVQQLAQGIQQGAQGLAKGIAGWVGARQESDSNKTLWEGIKTYYPGVINDDQDQKFYKSGLGGQRSMITQANAYADMMLKHNAPTWSPDVTTIGNMQSQGYAWAPTSRGAGQWVNTSADRLRNDKPALVQQADQTYGLIDLQSGQMTPVMGPGGTPVKGMPKSFNPYDPNTLTAEAHAPRIQRLQGEIAGLQQSIAGGQKPWFGGIFQGSYEAQLAQKQAELQQLQGGMPSVSPVAPAPVAPAAIPLVLPPVVPAATPTAPVAAPPVPASAQVTREGLAKLPVGATVKNTKTGIHYTKDAQGIFKDPQGNLLPL